MIYQFLYLVILAAARKLEPTRKIDLQLKLDKYQAATGIDDLKKNEIWNKTMDIRKCQPNDFFKYILYQRTIRDPKTPKKK